MRFRNRYTVRVVTVALIGLVPFVGLDANQNTSEECARTAHLRKFGPAPDALSGQVLAQSHASHITSTHLAWRVRRVSAAIRSGYCPDCSGNHNRVHSGHMPWENSTWARSRMYSSICCQFPSSL